MIDVKNLDDHRELIKALIEVQKEIHNPKTKEINPYYKSKYAPLPDILNLIRPILTKHGIAIYQNVSSTTQGISVETSLMHESGAVLTTNALTIDIGMEKGKTTPHAVGSIITYARRYQLLALLGIAAEDDDGNFSQKTAKTIKNQPSTPPRTTQKSPKAIKTTSPKIYTKIFKELQDAGRETSKELILMKAIKEHNEGNINDEELQKLKKYLKI